MAGAFAVRCNRHVWGTGVAIAASLQLLAVLPGHAPVISALRPGVVDATLEEIHDVRLMLAVEEGDLPGLDQRHPSGFHRTLHFNGGFGREEIPIEHPGGETHQGGDLDLYLPLP